MSKSKLEHRRKFLKFLLASPLFNLALPAGAQQDATLDPDLEYILNYQHALIKSPDDAENIFDFNLCFQETISNILMVVLHSVVLQYPCSIDCLKSHWIP